MYLACVRLTIFKQGIGWLLRKAVGVATITFIITQDQTAEGVDRLTIDQRGTGGLKGVTEVRVLDKNPSKSSDYVFGELENSNYWVKTAELTDNFLRDDLEKNRWEQDIQNGDAIKIDTVSSKKGWISEQVHILSTRRIKFY